MPIAWELLRVGMDTTVKMASSSISNLDSLNPFVPSLVAWMLGQRSTAPHYRGQLLRRNSPQNASAISMVVIYASGYQQLFPRMRLARNTNLEAGTTRRRQSYATFARVDRTGGAPT